MNDFIKTAIYKQTDTHTLSIVFYTDTLPSAAGELPTTTAVYFPAVAIATARLLLFVTLCNFISLCCICIEVENKTVETSAQEKMFVSL